VIKIFIIDIVKRKSDTDDTDLEIPIKEFCSIYLIFCSLN